MDSINQHQPEEAYEDLFGAEAQKKIKTLTNKAGTCFFYTVLGGKPFTTRPMAVQQVDEEGSIWFLSANDSHKNAEIAANPAVQLLFQGSDYSDFLSLSGTATITEDKPKIKDLWNGMLNVWFTGGVDDPRISAIKVTPQGGYYWDTKHNMAIGLIKRTVGAITGKTLDDSIEGKLSV